VDCHEPAQGTFWWCWCSLWIHCDSSVNKIC
jgi:hypothetical protein